MNASLPYRITPFALAESLSKRPRRNKATREIGTVPIYRASILDGREIQALAARNPIGHAVRKKLVEGMAVVVEL